VLLGLDVPPISNLTNWPAFAFKGSSTFALNKVGLIYLIAMALTLLIFLVGASQKKPVPTGMQAMSEMGVEFVRDQIVMQTIGPEGMAFMPYLTALFFFLFFSNIFEIIPYFQFPANARFSIPMILALVACVIVNGVGVVKEGEVK
jgi:F-type H+-transporting ATPase subunit a